MLLLLYQAYPGATRIHPRTLGHFCQPAFCCAVMTAQHATGGHASICLLPYRISKEPILSQVDTSDFTPEWDPLNPAFKGVAQVWAAAQEQAKASQVAPPAEQQAKQQPAQPKQAQPCQQHEVSPTARVTVAARSPRSPSGSGKRKLPAT